MSTNDFAEAEITSANTENARRDAHHLNSVISAMFMHIRALSQDSRIPADAKDSLLELEAETRQAAGLSRRLFAGGGWTTSANTGARTSNDGGVLSDQPKTGSETILFVEDEDSLRRVVVLNLRKLGYAVLEANGESKALELWEKHRATIDLLLTDFDLQGSLNGLELLAHVRRENKKLKAVVISGGAITAESTLAEDELTKMLAKPYDLAEVTGAIRDCLDRRSKTW